MKLVRMPMVKRVGWKNAYYSFFIAPTSAPFLQPHIVQFKRSEYEQCKRQIKVPKTVNNTLTPDGTETLETANFWNFIYSLTSGTPLDVTRHRGRQQWRHQRFMTSSKQFRRVCFLCVLPDTIVRVFTVSVTVTKICGKSSFSWFRHLGTKLAPI